MMRYVLLKCWLIFCESQMRAGLPHLTFLLEKFFAAGLVACLSAEFFMLRRRHFEH